MEVWIGLAVLVVALVAAALALSQRRWGSWSHLDQPEDDPTADPDGPGEERRRTGG